MSRQIKDLTDAIDDMVRNIKSGRITDKAALKLLNKYGKILSDATRGQS